MIELNNAAVNQIIDEINESSERDRRALAKRRHDIYKDGGRHFLIEQIVREFGREALKEMRLAPINLLKKIVNKRSNLYKKAPQRKTELESDQALVDFYTEELSINELMQKAHRYFTLFSNAVLYPRPDGDKITSEVVPPYLYSIVANPVDKTKIDSIVFNAFTEEGRMTPQQNTPAATGQENFSLERGFTSVKDKVGSNEIKTDERRQFIFWTDMQHFTTDHDGGLLLPEGITPEEGTVNPIEIKPIVNLAKDRDNETWATQGEDLVDLTIAIQLGWTDLLTIAKHQGFSILTIVSEEEPHKLTIGINRAVWLKQRPDGPAPSISYVTGNSPLDQYKELLIELLALLLTTNDMDPQAVGGAARGRNFTSGFHALIAMSDTVEAIEADKPFMLNAEKEHWELIKRWHNWLFDSGMLNLKARALGRFSEDFGISVQYADLTPLVSEDEVIKQVKDLRAEGLLTRRDALKKLNPDLSDDEIEAKLIAIDEEIGRARERVLASVTPMALPESVEA